MISIEYSDFDSNIYKSIRQNKFHLARERVVEIVTIDAKVMSHHYGQSNTISPSLDLLCSIGITNMYGNDAGLGAHWQM